MFWLQMDRAQCRAEHAQLLARVTAAADGDLDVLLELLQECHALTARMNAEASLRRDMRMQTLNAELFSVLMGNISRAFVAACHALSS